MSYVDKERERQYQKAYRAEHRAELLAYKKTYNAEHAVERGDYAKSYGGIKEAGKRYRAKHAEKIRVAKKKYEAQNADRLRQYRAGRYAKNPHKTFAHALKRRYGITPDQRLAMMEKQNHCCAICGKASLAGKRALSIDHCHKTGKFRGMLCIKCNTMIGMAKDSPRVLIAASRYLEEVT